jgi:amidase
MPALDDYARYDGLGLAELVARGEVSPSELLETAIEQVEDKNPLLNAVICPMFDEARREVQTELPDGPFRGVPFLLKDLGVSYAGNITTSGSRLFADDVRDFDSELVSRYRRAGLVIFGKTTSPEFGLTTTTESLLFGKTRNPWNPSHTSGGSSGGASAAVASGIVPMAHASDGGGSIRIPASCCGLFGLKPTRGRMPFGPNVGEGWSGLSISHVVTRSVRDSAALLDATRGPDLGAPYWESPVERPYLDEVGRDPGTLRIGFQREAFTGAPVSPDCLDAVDDAGKLCESLGHEIVPVKLQVDAAELGFAIQTIISSNLRLDVEDRLRRLGRELADDDLEPFTHIFLKAAADRNGADYARATRIVHAFGRQVEAEFANIDLLLTPTLAVPPLRIGELALDNPDIAQLAGNLVACSAFTQLFNVTGQPAASLPLHWNRDNLPIGVQFAAPFGREDRLFRLAGQLEGARPWFDRRP